MKTIDVSPAAVRDDIAGPSNYPNYLLSASELLDRAADLASESAILVHDNERRWRAFRQIIQKAAVETAEESMGSETTVELNAD